MSLKDLIYVVVVHHFMSKKYRKYGNLNSECVCFLRWLLPHLTKQDRCTVVFNLYLRQQFGGRGCFNLLMLLFLLFLKFSYLHDHLFPFLFVYVCVFLSTLEIPSLCFLRV